MSSDDVFVQYQGFHPSEHTQNFIRALLQEIHDESPYGSTVRAIFSKREGMFKGTINVRSAAGPFFVIALHGSLIEVAERLLRQMRRKLDKWKSTRFKQPSHPIRTKPSIRDDEYGSGVA